MGAEILKILVVEDHALVREAMAQTLARLDAAIDCIEASNAETALQKLDGGGVDLAIVDLMLPDMNGFALLGVLAKRFPDVPAIVVSAMDDEASVKRAIKGGASGFVSKASSGEEMLRAVRIVLDGGVHVPDAGSGTPAGRRAAGPVSDRFGLTAAQGRVTELLALGKSNREIADALGLSEGTVKVHMSAIFRALGVSSRAQALIVIARSGTRL